jgi:DNA (cytosine-5)-methyltransferase 1
LCGHRQPRWLYPDGLRAGAQDNATVRTVDEPAPTVLGSWDNGDTRWVVRTGQNSRQAGGTTEMYERPIDEAAATLTGQARSWVFGQPATTIAGDPRITARCHHEHGTQGADANTTDQVRAGDYQGTEPVKLTLTEALILQSFPPDYPVQGTKSKQFEQVGNAVPPLLAAHVIAALTGQALEAAA